MSSAQARFGVGSLDRKFGFRGRVLTPFHRSDAYASQAVMEPDGKIIIAGEASNTDFSRVELALARYRPNGALDPSFGSSGKVTTFLGSTLAFARGLALQANGKIVVVGGTAEHPVLARFDPNGSMDSTFGDRGEVVVPSYIDGAVLVQPDGKIVVGGSAPDGAHDGFAVARYNPNGSLDPAFGTGGKVTTSFGSYDAGAFTLALTPAGKIVAAGSAGRGFALARYNANGSLDQTFGSGGKVASVSPDPNTTEYLSGVALQPDGKIVAVGSIDEAGEHEEDGYFVLLRYSNTGAADPAFGSGRTVFVNPAIPGYGLGSSVAVQPDGKIVAAGSFSSWVGAGD